MPPRPEWAEMIDKAALMNAIWRYHPEYAAAYNEHEKAGQDNAKAYFVDALGPDWETRFPEAGMIQMTPEAGTGFYDFL